MELYASIIFLICIAISFIVIKIHIDQKRELKKKEIETIEREQEILRIKKETEYLDKSNQKKIKEIKQILKSNECVLYGIKEQAINLFCGYEELEEWLDVLGRNPMRDADMYNDILANNQEQKQRIERFFYNSFRKTIQQYLKDMDSNIEGYPFSKN